MWHVLVLLLGICLPFGAGTIQNGTVAKPFWCSNDNQFYCHLSDQCKPSNVKCDGTKHCEKGEDELNCPKCTKATALSMSKFFCEGSGKCVSTSWRCDGTEDCTQGEDEQNCGSQAATSCKPTEFPCGDGQCIDVNWKCDKQVDCNNKADESNCDATCASNQFACPANGTTLPQCIASTWHCDREKDCPGGEDEVGCAAISCPKDRFNCSAERKCMLNSWKCDGDNDCVSGEDEKDCSNAPSVIPKNRQCTSMEFKCVTGTLPCIIGAWKCDGDTDCSDGSDEVNCVDKPLECSKAEFKCEADKICIPGFLACSGKAECSDGADEKLPRCHHEEAKHCNLEKGEFPCEDPKSTFKSECVKLDRVCDGKVDCPTKRDENDEFCGDDAIVDPCAAKDLCGADPRITCTNVKTNLESNKNRTVGYVCKCPEGFSHVNNKCQDKDECKDAEHPVCDQICVNEPGKFRCECNPGYSLEEDQKFCKVNGNIHPKLLFTNRHEIRSIHIHGHGGYMPLLDSKAAVALDFDYASRQVFYSDMDEKKLFKFTLPSPDSEDDLRGVDLKIPGVQTPDGLAYDWIYKHLYWTDTTANTVNMACLDDHIDGNKPTTVLYKNKNSNCTRFANLTFGNEVCIDEPRALAVHPRKGWAFWSDWGAKPHIALGALDGSHMEMIAYNKNPSQQYLLWPNGLTLDLSSENERLYWIDARLHSLFSCTINRCISDITVLVYDTKAIKHPFSITVFENKLYWSDWTHKHIVSANKHTGGNMTTIIRNLEQPMDLKVFHPMSQQNSTNHCAQESDSEPKCEQICVPKPWSRNHTRDDFSPVALDQPRHRCLCSKGFTLHADGRRCTGEVISKVPPMVPARPTSTPKTAKGVARVQAAIDPKTSMSVGVIGAIAATIVLVVALVVSLVIFMLLRRIKQNKSKSMNFDNPIYKRTTEDKLELPRHEYQPSQSEPSATVPLTLSESPSGHDDYDV